MKMKEENKYKGGKVLEGGVVYVDKEVRIGGGDMKFKGGNLKVKGKSWK